MHPHVSITSAGVRGGRHSLVLTLLVLVFAVPAYAQTNCEWVNCKTICDHSHPNFSPQECDSCCHNTNTGGSGQHGTKDEINQRMAAMEAEIKKLTIMVGVILAILGMVLLLGIVKLVLSYTSTKTLKEALPVFFKSNNEGRASIEKRPPPPTKAPQENRNSTVVRIANYQNNHSPLNKRMRANGQTVHHESTVPDHTLAPSDHLPRARQPSESTCPDDSADLPHSHQHAYDNLALSTSTLHDTTTSSTSTLGPAVSTHTLDTTLPSVNPSVSTMI